MAKLQVYLYDREEPLEKKLTAVVGDQTPGLMTIASHGYTHVDGTFYPAEKIWRVAIDLENL